MAPVAGRPLRTTAGEASYLRGMSTVALFGLASALAVALGTALAVLVVALRRAAARAVRADARRAALVARTDAARLALRDLQALPLLDARLDTPVRAVQGDPRRPSSARRAPVARPDRLASDSLPPAPL